MVFLRSPDKGFWACLGDLPPDMPRWPETWVSLCNLRLKHRVISRSSAILGSDSPQSNNRKDNSFWVTPFIPRERPNVKHHSSTVRISNLVFRGQPRIIQCTIHCRRLPLSSLDYICPKVALLFVILSFILCDFVIHN